MSGTSLDGVDVACCNFTYDNSRWKFSIIAAKTFVYDNFWRKQLKDAALSSGIDLIMLHKTYGTYLGRLVNEFLAETGLKPDFIASHGHTIFHQPDKKLTFQLGDGAFIASETGITAISDFRNLDVALGGQGAPLVPVGDELLFGNYSQCLNFGGFANVSFRLNDKRIAYDICPVNIVINELARELFGVEYDKDGEIGKSGTVDLKLLQVLNHIDFYKQKPPKSLGREWVEQTLMPMIMDSRLTARVKMRTIYEHIAGILANDLSQNPGNEILTTGGGANNKFLIDLVVEKSGKALIAPEKQIVEYKEALIFAFLGVLRIINQPNCLASVTGASRDNCGGIVHLVNSVS